MTCGPGCWNHYLPSPIPQPAVRWTIDLARDYMLLRARAVSPFPTHKELWKVKEAAHLVQDMQNKMWRDTVRDRIGHEPKAAPSGKIKEIDLKEIGL